MKKNASNKAFTSLLSLLFINASGLILSNSWAADTDVKASAESKEIQEKPKKPGFYTDSFHILPEIQITGYYDDNIYATNLSRESDYIGIVSPTLKINSRWDKHSLKFDTGANVGRYADFSDENYEDWWVEASGRYEFSTATHLFGGLGYNKKHEGRDSKESNIGGARPTTYDVQSMQLGVRHRINDYVVRVGATYEDLDYDNVGIIYNDDRDRTHTGVGLRVSKGWDKKTKLFAQALLNNRDYDEDPDQFGFYRDSDGYTAAVGFISNFGKKDRVEGYLGVLSQDYDDSEFSRVTKPDFGISLRMLPAETYKFTANLKRSLGETTQIGSSGYLYTKLSLQLDKKMFSDYVGYISYGYGDVNYQESSREDTINSFGLGLNYYLSPHIFLSGSYSYIDNNSNVVVAGVDALDYDKNLFLISFKAKLAP